jgi:hypothetical protein
MRQPDDMRSAASWQSPAEPRDEDGVVIGSQAAVREAGETQSPPDHPYPPAGQADPAADRAYLAAGQADPGGQMRSPDEMPPRGETQADEVLMTEPETRVTDTDAASQAEGTDRQWSEVMAMFVDDPRGSVQLAAGLAEHAVEDLVASVRQRQASLASAWQDTEAGTEALRATLREYRAFWAIVRDMPAADVTAARSGVTRPRSDTYPGAGDAARISEPGPGRTPA